MENHHSSQDLVTKVMEVEMFGQPSVEVSQDET